MERHEEKIRATIKRNKKIITFTTLVGLICPATLGTIQALADETAPPTEQAEQVEQPVSEPVTPEQPTEAPSQEPVTPEPVETVATEPEQTAPIEQITEVAPTESVQAQSPVTAEPVVTPQADLSAELAEWNNFFAQIIPLLDELESKVIGTDFQSRYDELQNRFDFASFTGGQFPESTRDQAFYDQWLPELASILADLQQLKADISSEPTVSVTGVTLAPIPEMGEGGTYQLTATVMPENATNRNVTFSSSDTSVATVDANGLVTAIAKGSFTITVTTVDGNYTATASSTVKEDDGTPLKDFDYTAVLAAIARYDAMVKDKDSYTLESWEAMEAEMINNDEKLHFIDYLRKLPEAEGSIPPGYENQLQTDLNNYAAWAHTVMDMAIKKDVTPPKDVDKSELEEAIKKGEQAIKDGNWKDDSKLVTVIEDGKKILNDDKATQAQVDEATKNINDAINALEKADNNGGNGNNGNGNSGSNGNSNGSNSNNGTGNNNQNTNTNQNKANNSNNQSNKNNTNNKDNLPLTGDTTTNGLLAGLSMVGLSAITLLKRKRKA